MDDELFRVLARAGQWAPSAENRHFLRVRKETDGISLIPQPAYWSDHPVHQRLHQMGFGAVAENIRIAAGASGFDAQISWFDSVNAGHPVGQIALAQSILENSANSAHTALNQAIAQRCTNRSLHFRPPALSPAQRESFQDALHSLPGMNIFWASTAPTRQRLYQLAQRAEAARFANPVLHRELFAGIRFEAGWQAPTAEGIPPGALGIEWGARSSFAQLRHWSIAKPLSRLGLHQLIGLRAARLPFMLSPDIAVITSARQDPATWFRAGQSLERLWLMATVLGCAVQPAAAAALYAAPGFPGVPEKLQQQLAQGWQQLIGDQAAPCILLRIGHAPIPAIRTARPPLDEFIHN